MKIAVIFPHQLFKDKKELKECEQIFLIEENLFFKQKEILFHKQKILLHRASLKFYEEELKKEGFKTKYFVHQENILKKALENKKITEIISFKPSDFLLEKKLKKLSKINKIKLHLLENPNFLTDSKSIQNFLSQNKKKKFIMQNFYIFQRKRLNILLDENKKPLGGKWSFDSENRKKLEKDENPPQVTTLKENKFVKEAKKYLEKNFKNHPGEIKNFIFPTTRKEAQKLFKDFLQNKLEKFGKYQDSISQKSTFVYHSLLSSSINTGLLSPQEVVKNTLSYVKTHKIPLNSLEGFLRQIIGWREFMRIEYALSGVKMRNSNFFKHQNKIPKSFWEGKTGLLPIDETIKKVTNYAYAHHIERLMILGNFMLLTQIHPTEIYNWFMAMFIDSYDWVMVPNVYAMSQFSSGGLFTTKPYFSSSNYIKKMSDYPKGDWQEIWDGLFWNFINNNKKELEKNYRLRLMVKQIEKMDQTKLKSHLKVAKKFLKDFHS